MRHIKYFILSLLLYSAFSASASSKIQTDNLKAQLYADSILGTMSLDEKIGQLFVYTIPAVNSQTNRNTLLRLINEDKIGGLLFQKGTCEGQAEITNLAQSTSRIPLMITMDGEWGLQMRLSNTLRYPRKLTLSALDNDSIIFDWGRELGRQCKLMGINVNFDPILDVNLNPKNPVINVRSFGDDPKDIARKASIFIRGMHDYNIACVGKHFPGHGDTQQDSHKELASVEHDRMTLDSVDLMPYRRLIKRGLLDGVMVGHLSVPALDGSRTPASLSKKIVSGVLKEQLGFEGLVFTDAMVMGAVQKIKRSAVEALKAGADVILDMGDVKSTENAIAYVKDAVDKEQIPLSEIDAKCRKILIYKYLSGAADFKRIDVDNIASQLNSPAAKRIQQRIARGCVTVTHNRARMLPIRSLERNIVLVTLGNKGETYFSTRIAKYTKAHRENLMLNDCRKSIPTALDSIVRNADVAIFAIHDDQVPDSVLAQLSKDVKGKVVHAYFISPYMMSKYSASIKQADACVIGYENAQCMQYAVADAVFGGNFADAHLPVAVENVYPKGKSILTIKNRLGFATPEDVNMSSNSLSQIDSICAEAIKDRSTPSCQVVIARHGMIVYDKAFGTPDYESTRPASVDDIYDLASVTKLMGTLPAVMKLYDEEKIDLNEHVTHYLPNLKKLRRVTVRDLLMHQSGLPASKAFYMSAIKGGSAGLFGKKDAVHTVQVDNSTYANPDFCFKPELISNTEDEKHALPIADDLYINPAYKDTVMNAVANIKPGEKKYVYSDINFIILGFIVESVSGMPLDEYVHEAFYKPIGASTTGFLPLHRFNKSRIMPTADDQFLRKQTLQGYVHDENAAFLGGVSGHAGLFSNAEDLAKFCQIWLQGGAYGGHTFFSEETCDIFLNAKSEISRRGLGFDRQKIEESANKEHTMIGHTGFTGTCVWIDPNKDLTYIFLSNRVNPNAWNRKLIKTNVRTRIASIIYQSIKDK